MNLGKRNYAKLTYQKMKTEKLFEEKITGAAKGGSSPCPVYIPKFVC